MTRLVRALALVWALALTAACVTPVAEVAPPAGGPTLTIWVVDHGWHTAIAVRRIDVDAKVWPAVEDFPAATLLETAWGEREFYTTPNPSTWMAIRAALGSSESVLHVAGLDVPATETFPRSQVVALPVARPGLDALIRFVADEHRRDSDGRLVRVQPGLYARSWFYAARSRYSLSHTCNTWVARALQVAGLPVTPSGVVTASGVMEQLAKIRLPNPP
jgi:uncharacterized protein (TIGR02117 family)